MDKDKLITAGLTAPQAESYALLMQLGQLTPPIVADKLKLTRTNAYKVLDKLVELGLASKTDEHKKFVYRPTNPSALTALAQDLRNEASAREEAASSIVQELLNTYYKHTSKPGVETFTGKKAVYESYRRQINLKEDIYFVRTIADIPAMGFDTMHEIRVSSERFGIDRYGILPVADAPFNTGPHKRSNLTGTYFDRTQYTAPVEWSVTDSSLLVVSYEGEPQSILITDPMIALAFKQLWKLMNSYLQAEPFHHKIADA